MFALVVAATGAFPAYADSMSYLDNGVIRLGVDLAKGGPITYLSNSGADLKGVNSWDLNRPGCPGHLGASKSESNGGRHGTGSFYRGVQAGGGSAGGQSKVMQRGGKLS